MSIFRNLINTLLEPTNDDEDVLIPADPAEVPPDLYLVPDEGDKEHQEQLDEEIGIGGVEDGPVEEAPPDGNNR
jgi:hypothetical protein